MGTYEWYLNDDNTDSSYTDFTQMTESRPVMNRQVNMASANYAHIVNSADVAAAGRRKKEKSTAGKVFRYLFTCVLLIALSSSVTWYYLNAKEGGEGSDIISVFGSGLKEKFEGIFSHAGAKEKEIIEEDTEDEVEEDISEASDFDPQAAYAAAENIMSTLWCDNEVDTARAIFNWVHSNVTYLPLTTELSYEEAAYRGFTRKSGDCDVYFACSKMLLDCAGIPNIMVERYPVYDNGHYWNLVLLDGEWYHCDATVFKDHPGLYFMCTDDEIGDSHHSFDGSLYPERATSSSYYWDDDVTQPEEEYDLDVDTYEYNEEDYEDDNYAYPDFQPVIEPYSGEEDFQYHSGVNEPVYEIDWQ